MCKCVLSLVLQSLPQCCPFFFFFLLGWYLLFVTVPLIISSLPAFCISSFHHFMFLSNRVLPSGSGNLEIGHVAYTEERYFFFFFVAGGRRLCIKYQTPRVFLSPPPAGFWHFSSWGNESNLARQLDRKDFISEISLIRRANLREKIFLICPTMPFSREESRKLLLQAALKTTPKEDKEENRTVKPSCC